jgi:hypothetical protein
MKNKKYKEKLKPAFTTFPIADQHEKEPESNVSIPSLRNTKEAKDWVDANEK